MTGISDNGNNIWLGIMGIILLVISTWLGFAILTALLKSNKKLGLIYLVLLIVGAAVSLYKLFHLLPYMAVVALIIYLCFGAYAYYYMKKK